MELLTEVDPAVVAAYKSEGFGIARGLFSQNEVDFYSKYFTDMVERGGDGWSEGAVDSNHPDPLKRYPRLLQPHRGDDVAIGYMLDPRIREYLTALAGTEPYAVQTMVYFKPPGGRGQNLHQDNMFLLVAPGTCMAAWLALDDCDEENGCMMLVPGTQDFPMICQVDTPGIETEHWGTTETPLPPGMTPVPALMKRGDVLFFNGSVIHGSMKNKSERFRRTLIGHYIAAEATQVAKYYFPVFRMDGSRLDEDAIARSVEGGPCGVYNESGEIEVTSTYLTWDAAH